MKALLAVVLGSMSAGAATFEGTAVHNGQPVADANVRMFVRSEEAVLGCPPYPEGAVLGPCGCPAGTEDLTARLLKGEGGAKPMLIATTNAEGKFAFTLPAGGVVLVATIESKDGALWGQAVLRGPKQLFALERTAPLRVELSQNSTGAILYRLNRLTRELARIEDPKAVRVPPGGQMMVVVAPGMLPRTAWAQDATSPMYSQLVVGDVHTTKITLEPPVMVKATVMLDGKPVAGAEFLLDPEGCRITGKSDENGEISVPGSAGVFARMIEVRSGELSARGHFHREGKNVLALKKQGGLEVSFVDAKGAAVPNVEAYLNFGARDWPPRSADAKGRWLQAVLPLEEMSLRVLPPWVLIDDAKIKVTGVMKKQLRVQKGVTLSGRVLDSAGFPANKVKVTAAFGEVLAATASPEAKDGLLWGRRAWTDMSGEFEIGGLLPGAYTLTAQRGDVISGTASVTAPGRVEIKKYAPFVLTGSVVEEGGAPVVGITVVLHVEGAENRSVASGISDVFGNYRVELPAAGNYVARVWRKTPGAVPVAKTVQIGAKKNEVRFELPRVAGMRGTVVDEAGAPVEGARLEALPVTSVAVRMAELHKRKVSRSDAVMAKANNELAEAVSSPDGSFLLVTGLESFVFVTAKGFQAKELRVKPGEPLKVVLAR